jgi:integrase
MKRDDIPRGVFPKGRWYYLVVAVGPKRVWIKLSKIADGLPALYIALAREKEAARGITNMPSLVAAWQTEVMPGRGEKTQTDDKARCKLIAEAFAEFTPADVDAPACAEFLKGYKPKPRTHNAFRSLLRELMRFAEEKGLRPSGSNPLQSVRTMSTPPRTRYITDSEMRRIKVGGIYGDDGRRTRSGLMLAALVDMAYLTGQDIGMLLDLRWTRDPFDHDAPHVADAGLFFRRAKVQKTTGAAVLVQWTPRLRDVVQRLKVMRAERQLKKRATQRVVTDYLFTTQGGKQLTYSGAASAWRRAVKRAGVPRVMFRDLRAKALTDKEEREGMQAARHMGAHATEAQTADYVRQRAPRKTGATR